MHGRLGVDNKVYLICELTWRGRRFKLSPHLCELFSKASEDFVLEKITNSWQVFVPAATAEPTPSHVQMQLIISIYNPCSCVCTVTIGEQQLLPTCCLPIFVSADTCPSTLAFCDILMCSSRNIKVKTVCVTFLRH